MSRRPAIKIVPPFFLGVLCINTLPPEVGVIDLLLINCILLFVSLTLLRRLAPLVRDVLLLFSLFLTGVAAGTLDEAGPYLDPALGRGANTVILEVTGFCRLLREDLTMVEGRLRYVNSSGEFVSYDAPVLIYLKGDRGSLDPGDLVVANGNLEMPDRRKNPGGGSQEESFRRRGLIWLFRSTKDQWSKISTGLEFVHRTSPGVALRRSIGLTIDGMFEREEADFLKGILLGARGNISEKRRSDFSGAGIYHILAISGLHIGIISGILYLLFSILRLPPLFRVAASIPVLLTYGVVTGMRPSIQRAIAMVVSLGLASTLQRKVDIVNLLFMVGACVVYFAPSLLGDPGFQMSFLATWGIVALYPGLARMLKPLALTRFAVTRALFGIVAVSVCAQIPLIPVIASSFHTLSLVSPLANIIAIPTMALLFPSALLSVCTRMISSSLSIPFSEVSSLLIALLFETSALFSRIPGASLRISPLDTSTLVTYFALLFLTSQFLEGRVRGVFLLFVILLGCNVWLARDIFSGSPPMRVTCLDIGQGDGAVIEFPSGDVMVMDGGPRSGEWDAGERIIEPFLLDRGIERINMLAASHPHLDHIGGFPFLIERFEVDAILDPGQSTSLSHYSEILERAISRDIRVYLPRRGDSFTVGEVKVEFMHPAGEWVGRSSGQDDVNNVSLVARLTYGQIAILMTGDIGPVVEEDLILAFGDGLKADILKVAHHGSGSSSTLPFVSAVNPAVAVISVGRRNRLGHPAPFLVEMMKKNGIEVLRTDIYGALVFVVRRDWYEVLDGSGEVIYSSDTRREEERGIPRRP